MPTWELGHKGPCIGSVPAHLGWGQIITTSLAENSWRFFLRSAREMQRDNDSGPQKILQRTNIPSFTFLRQFIDVNISSLPRYCSCSFREWQERWQRFLLCVRDEKTWTHRQEMTWAVSAFQAQGQVPINPGSALKLPILSFPPLITCCCKIMCFRCKPNNNEIPLFYIKLAI